MQIDSHFHKHYKQWILKQVQDGIRKVNFLRTLFKFYPQNLENIDFSPLLFSY